jgi:predicted acetyltransferase
LATEATRAVLALAAEAGMDEVLALTDLDNTPSQRVTFHDRVAKPAT